MVTLFVGPNKIKFATYEDILSEASDFFKSAFSSRFKEGQEKMITLPEESEEIMEFVIFWLDEREHGKTVSFRGRPLRFGLELHVFADKMQMKTLKAEAMHLVAQHAQYCPVASFVTPENISYIYETTPDHSGLRRLAVWLWTWKLAPGRLSGPGSMALLEVSLDFKKDALASLFQAFDSTQAGSRGPALLMGRFAD